MPKPPQTLEEHLSAAQIAARIGVDESTVWEWAKNGKLKGKRKLGRKCVRWPASAVNAFLEARVV